MAASPQRPERGTHLRREQLRRRETARERDHLRALGELEDIADVLAIDPKSLKTEGEVSTYIQRATAILHTQARKP